MAHRNFTDSNGVSWDVWDVVPRWAERRRLEHRDTSAPPPERPAQERRRGQRPHELRVRVSQGLEQGWLVFEARGERRRLAPAPSGWEQATDAELEALCRAATPAGRGRRRLIE